MVLGHARSTGLRTRGLMDLWTPLPPILMLRPNSLLPPAKIGPLQATNRTISEVSRFGVVGISMTSGTRGSALGCSPCWRDHEGQSRAPRAERSNIPAIFGAFVQFGPSLKLEIHPNESYEIQVITKWKDHRSPECSTDEIMTTPTFNIAWTRLLPIPLQRCFYKIY